jgi:hypothetical protein
LVAITNIVVPCLNFSSVPIGGSSLDVYDKSAVTVLELNGHIGNDWVTGKNGNGAVVDVHKLVISMGLTRIQRDRDLVVSSHSTIIIGIARWHILDQHIVISPGSTTRSGKV